MRSHFWLMWGLLIIAVFCLSEQPEPVLHSRNPVPHYYLVYVKTCLGEQSAMIYSDAKRSIPMANPFVTLTNEGYAFYTYTDTHCVHVEVK